MAYSLALIVLTLGAQAVPAAPDLADDSATLRAELRAIHETEAAQLSRLAAGAEKSGRSDDAKSIRGWIDPPVPENGPLRFVPLPEFVALDDPPDAPEPGLADARRVRSETVEALMVLARQAGGSPQGRYGLAITCLRGVLDRDPGNREARRLIGYVAHNGGWATPHAARNLAAGYILHPEYGWVQDDWVEHLEKGELPGVLAPGRPVSWLPAEQADALRADFFRRPWQISTEHFDIATNVPLAEAISLGRRLEHVRDAFMTLFADVLGPEFLTIDNRFHDPELWASPSDERHQIWYFADRADYLAFFRRLGRDESISLGFYMPATDARRYRLPPRSYFFRNQGDPLDGLPTLFHEASHQLLFELAGPTQYERNVGQYWLWEGLGTYFETFTPRPDGAYEIGGLVGPRIARAREDILTRDVYTPISELLAMGAASFKDESKVNAYYAESMALVVFLMHADGAAYRDGFLDYVADAYRGQYPTRRRGTNAHGATRRAGRDARWAFSPRSRRGGRPHRRRSETRTTRTRREPASSGRGMILPELVALHAGSALGNGHSPTYGSKAMKRARLTAVLEAALEGRAIAAPLSREHLALVGAELLQQADVLVIDVRWAGAAFRRAEAAAILAVATEAFTGHGPRILGQTRDVVSVADGSPSGASS